MANKQDSFDIKQFAKPGKYMVIELDDDVEYIIDDESVTEMIAGKEQINLIRVVDRAPKSVSARRIKWAILKDGIVDYLDSNHS